MTAVTTRATDPLATMVSASSAFALTMPTRVAETAAAKNWILPMSASAVPLANRTSTIAIAVAGPKTNPIDVDSTKSAGRTVNTDALPMSMIARSPAAAMTCITTPVSKIRRGAIVLDRRALKKLVMMTPTPLKPNTEANVDAGKPRLSCTMNDEVEMYANIMPKPNHRMTA